MASQLMAVMGDGPPAGSQEPRDVLHTVTNLPPRRGSERGRPHQRPRGRGRGAMAMTIPTDSARNVAIRDVRGSWRGRGPARGIGGASRGSKQPPRSPPCHAMTAS
jgi:hypothetical protein